MESTLTHGVEEVIGNPLASRHEDVKYSAQVLSQFIASLMPLVHAAPEFPEL